MGGLIGILTGIFGAVFKNPYVAKLLLFVSFNTVLTIVINEVKGLLFPYLSTLSNISSNITFFLCKVSFFEMLNFYISALLSVFVFKQIIGFMKG